MLLMDPLELTDADGARVMLCFDGTVVEVFHTSYDKSFRIPAAWLAVGREDLRHERVRLKVGRTKLDRPIYGPAPDDWTSVAFEVDATGESLVSQFLAAVAQAVGRSWDGRGSPA